MRQNYIIIPRILSNRGYLYSTKTDVCANLASIDEPFVDICDHLEGEHPKDFKFVGWHPLCRCITTNILKTKEERREDRMRIMRGEAPIPPEQSKNYVGDTPDQFKAWCRLNAGRVERAKSVPYFIRDNRGYYDSVIAPKYGVVQGMKLGRTAEKEAYRLYKDLPAPKLSKEVEANTKEIANSLGITHAKPMTFLEANEGRSNVNYSKGLEYKENCQCCVVTHEARLRGLNITSVGYSYNRASMSWKLGEHFEMAWINPKTNNIPVVQVVKGNNDNATLLALEKQMQAVGRYHVGVNFKNGSGHIITAERLKNGNLIYYDAQNGEFLNIKDYAALDYLEVLKVDKLLINKNVLMEIVELL